MKYIKRRQERSRNVADLEFKQLYTLTGVQNTGDGQNPESVVLLIRTLVKKILIQSSSAVEA